MAFSRLETGNALRSPGHCLLPTIKHHNGSLIEVACNVIGCINRVSAYRHPILACRSAAV